MKAILTVIGTDKVGIIAKVTSKLAALGINVLDLSQTIMQGNFTMVMLVNMDACTESFEKVQQSLSEFGNEMELSIRIQRTEIFDAMHSI